ncbi:hypothetical protein FH966_07405 [Lentibacillus cibarius]|uniref:Uncharacterized protein n=1 Tax=Lentibacillus cibarius TaxID=2583219 RepID=A0A549YI27_9BACI|nr:hypothetical protein [Lentibacillus cibarius]TRM11535.1 hypothetical protein FH966_07405 [Lentibacillus cibarius]
MNTWMVKNVSIIIVSLIGGLIFHYISSPSKQARKKQELESITSLLVNFILFVWVGKLLINLPLLFTNPLAVLAYPSSSTAFIIAVLLTTINIIYQVKRKSMDYSVILASFVPVFLGSAFLYEFIDLVWHENTFAWGHQGLLLLLIVVFLITHEKLSPILMACVILTGWSAGQLIIAYTMPYTALYGYTMPEWFLFLVFATSIITFVYNRRRIS